MDKLYFSFEDQACCLGSQLVRLLKEFHSLDSGLIWYVAHALPYIGGTNVDAPKFTYFGSTEQLIESVKDVHQFLQGVFAAVGPDKPQPSLRDPAHTDDETSAQLGDAIFEIRAFDSSYFEIIFQDRQFAQRFRLVQFSRPLISEGNWLLP